MVREAIASVLAQRGVDYELIVVDDGSTDGSAGELEAQFADARPMSFRLIRAAHGGPASARNRGVASAVGEFVAFLDSDDLWMPTKLERQLAFMRAHPDLRIAQCNERWLRDGRPVNPARRHRKRAGEFFEDSLRTCLVSLSATIMRTDFFRALGGFDPTLVACEDYDLWLRVLVESPIGLLDEPLAIRRAGHPGQLSATVPALDRFRIIAIMKILGHERLTARQRAEACDVMIEKCGIYGAGLERRGRFDQARLCRATAAAADEAWREAADAALQESIELMRALIRTDEAAAAVAEPLDERG
jgi:glycosyltransferase involved in cell wall biosynthesis